MEFLVELTGIAMGVLAVAGILYCFISLFFLKWEFICIKEKYVNKAKKVFIDFVDKNIISTGKVVFNWKNLNSPEAKDEDKVYLKAERDSLTSPVTITFDITSYEEMKQEGRDQEFDDRLKAVMHLYMGLPDYDKKSEVYLFVREYFPYWIQHALSIWTDDPAKDNVNAFKVWKSYHLSHENTRNFS